MSEFGQVPYPEWFDPSSAEQNAQALEGMVEHERDIEDAMVAGEYRHQRFLAQNVNIIEAVENVLQQRDDTHTRLMAAIDDAFSSSPHFPNA